MKKENIFLYLLSLLLVSGEAWAFCGFYVAKADAKLFNQASQVVLVRHEDKSVLSMMNDYEGELSQFALVVPVPQVLKKGQINVGDPKLFAHIDAFTAPRLVEYFDLDPCEAMMLRRKVAAVESAAVLEDAPAGKPKDYGVKVEAEYTVGEYDIVILSATESSGLENWLIDNEYNIPRGAREALAPYIKQKMKFFVAKVNLKEQSKTGLQKLRPLQFAFESEKFMLPIRLGMVNAKGPQDLLLYVITKNGRVETTNYRTVKLPTGMDIPVYVKEEFPAFYKAMFSEQVKKENGKAVFTEYFWDMGWCDPCAADPMSPEDLQKLGVFWLKKMSSREPMRRGVDAVVTRLHVRYDKNTFPEDLMFQETNDKRNFQGRYVLRHAWKGSADKCEQVEDYLAGLPERFEKEAQNLANLTGWEVNDIRAKMDFKAPEKSNSSWWQGLWGK